jgi:uncharacterized repeat protein (TIGR04138 family)
MQEVNFDEVVEQLVAKDARFHRDAYAFMREALGFTQKLMAKENAGKVRHVTGRELLDGIRQYALSQYGPMTMTVLEEWGVTECRHFGDLVFNMIEGGLLQKTDADSPNDFTTGYDFTDAFRKPYWPANRLKAEAKTVAN